MAVFDTGPIENRAAPRRTQLTIRLFNTGKLPALVGAEAYSNAVNLVSLNPFGTLGSSFSVDNTITDEDVFGVRVLTSGLDANNIAIPIFEKGSEEVEITPDNSRAYVTNTGINSITVLDTATNGIIATLPTGKLPADVAITPNSVL